MTSEEQKFNLPSREEKILEFWERERVFEKSLQKTKRGLRPPKRATAREGGKPFIFYEGPPTANAAPGIHHVEARAFKDVILRYKTMRGFYVSRKAGWDTHGLPVELAVERELGLKTKKDIERYGIVKFNEKCRESVWRYKEEWERLTQRIGFWLDLAHPYITYETSYIETLWWIIKEIWEKGLLYKGFKIIPWCPRCQTGLSSHELGQPGAYKKVKEDSIFVRLKIKGKKNESLLVWTTTPWTLPANVAVAVNPAVEYTKYKVKSQKLNDKSSEYEYVWSATVPPYDADQEVEIVEKTSGKALVGLAYEPLYNSNLQLTTYNAQPPYKVVGADFVATEEGSGFVHLAPAYGEEDMAAMKREYSAEYPILETVNPDGTMKKGVIAEGQFVKDADAVITEDLKKRKLLFFVLPYEHDYPHCWRCGTPLLYYARNSWWVRTTKVKDELIKNNRAVDWIPEHIKEGRFGEFLRDLRDWAFSRERYWGTPLPAWVCRNCKAVEVVGSLKELAERAPQSGNTYFAMRHGEALSNMKDKVSCALDGRYRETLRGLVQDEHSAKRLKKEKIDLIFASDILRTKETADVAAKILGIKKVHIDPRLREINTGIFEGRPSAEYHKYFSSALEKFTKPPPNGETLTDVRKRMVEFIEEMEKKYSGKTILIVSHEYPLWMMYAGALGLSNEETVALRIGKRKEDFIRFAEVMRVDYRKLPRDQNREVNLHRPYSDDFILPCPKCNSGEMARVKDVVDAWFDSGAMPFAQAHFPFACAKLPATSYQLPACWKKLLFPADYIAEGVDQTRGWFYTLLTVSTLLEKEAPYRHVISLGHVLDKNGQKMSKSKGNVVDPWEMIKKYGADAIRWYFFTVNPPGEPKHFEEKDLLAKLRGPLATFWNSFVFFATYVDKVSYQLPATSYQLRNVLDRWVLARLKEVIEGATERLERYDIVGAARLIEEFLVEDFSNWYLRRSRRRFQRPETKAERQEAAEVMAEVLATLSKLFAPFAPFIAEIVWLGLRQKSPLKEASVHLALWPERALLNAEEKRLLVEMKEARALSTLFLALRAKAGIKVRQPLLTAEAPEAQIAAIGKKVLGLIKEEVNVKEIRSGIELRLDTTITRELREEGLLREFVRNVQEMRKDLGLRPEHRIKLQIVGGEDMARVLERSREFVEKETGAEKFSLGGKKVFAVERELALNGHELWVGVDKA